MDAVNPFVFVFESPKPDEIARGVGEGEDLLHTLSRMNIRGQPFQPATTADLRNDFAQVLDALTPVDGQPLFWPTFYVSAHGDQQGILLTGEYVPWSVLRELLLDVGAKLHGFDHESLHCGYRPRNESQLGRYVEGI
ncbi:MAG TPA: hypothetical protein VHZ24_12195 [Pirellulales bacterium]|jgi:hypothetical protein|nr:hypothetical protein [Pirellulales bacterium]